eukprot:scaffold1355_cov268-Pinguiococcus_pyrenoidosus.AAC.62
MARGAESPLAGGSSSVPEAITGREGAGKRKRRDDSQGQAPADGIVKDEAMSQRSSKRRMRPWYTQHATEARASSSDPFQAPYASPAYASPAYASPTYASPTYSPANAVELSLTSAPSSGLHSSGKAVVQAAAGSTVLEGFSQIEVVASRGSHINARAAHSEIQQL